MEVPAFGGVHLGIVDPIILTEVKHSGQVGELWIASDSVAQGYWGDYQSSMRTFSATVSILRKELILQNGDREALAGSEAFHFEERVSGSALASQEFLDGNDNNNASWNNLNGLYVPQLSHPYQPLKLR